MVDEATGEVRFRDYVEDDHRMRILFEEFVRNFYRRELHGWSVRGNEKIAWDLDPLTPEAARYVPEMRTDITLRRADRTVIIDTKFYAEAFVARFENDKLRSAHLYQLTAYLRNLAVGATGPDASAAGVLLYPETHPLPTLPYQYGPHRLTATGVDLTHDWRAIHRRLLDIVENA